MAVTSRLRKPGVFLLAALLIVCLLRPQRLFGARSKGAVRAAYNSQQDRYLLVWADGRNSALGDIDCYEEPGCNQDIYGSILHSDLHRGPEIPISAELGEQHFPDVAYNSRRNEFLVVYHLRTVDFDIYAARVSADGVVLQTIPVCTEVYDQWEPTVAYDAINDRYLVAWMGYFHGGWGKDVQVQLFTGDASKIGASHTVSLGDAGTPADGKQERPAVAFSPEEQKYIVVWDDEGRQGGSGTVLDKDGNVVISPANFFFTQGSARVLYPHIGYSASDRQALVVWQEALDDGSKRVVGQRLSLAGRRVGSPVTVAHYQSSFDPRPSVGCDDTNGSCLVGWMDTVYGIGRLQFLDRYGQKVGEEMSGVSGARPSITFNPNHRHFLVVSGDNPAVLKLVGALPPAPASTPTPIPTRTALATGTPSASPTMPPGSAVTVAIQNGVLGDVQDTHIYQDDPNRNYCLGRVLKVGYRQRYAAPLHFDLSPIPGDAIVSQARLELYAKGWGGTDTTFDVHRLLRPVSVCQATWNEARSGESWSLPGCGGVGTDRSAVAESSVDTHSIGRWYAFDLTGLVQGWVDGSVFNHGVVVRQAVAWSTGEFHFSSSWDSTFGLRPKLVVTYRPVEGPTATATSGPAETSTPTRTSTATATDVPGATRTSTATPTPTHSLGPTSTSTRTPTTGPSRTSTATPTATPSAIQTRTPTETVTPTHTPPGQLVTLTLQQGTAGYAGCEDAHIYQYDPDRNYCRESALEVGYKQRHAAVLRFDLASVPQHATLLQASLQLYARGWGGLDTTFNVHRILRPVDLCQTTWNQAQSAQPWALPGCNGVPMDRSAAAESSVDTDGVAWWYRLDLTGLVQAWLDGSVPNYGLLLREASPLTLGKFFFTSSEDSAVHLRPKLVLTYRVLEGPTATASTTAVPSASPTRTHTSTMTPPATGTPTATASMTGEPTATSFPTSSPTFSATPTPTATQLAAPTPTPSPLPTGSEVTVALQQGKDGYTGCENTYLYQYTPDQNYCRGDALQVGYRQRYGALLRFDLSSIPAGAPVSQASLQLYAKGWGGEDATLALHRLLRSFDACQATWNQATASEPWGQPGCNDTLSDLRAIPESSVGTDSIGRWYSFDLTALVQAWLDGSQANHGVLLRGALPYSQGLFYFANAKDPSVDNRPKLVIRYRPPQGPVGTSTPTPLRTETPTPTASLSPLPGGETTVSLQQGAAGYAGCEDTFIYQYAPNTNYCFQSLLKVGYKQRSATMVRFDLSSIPAHVSIVQAQLQLHAAGWGGTDMTVDAHRILRQGRLCEATWNHARGVVSWGVPGCNDPSTDRSAIPESSVATSGIGKWYHFDVSDLVQDWLNGTLLNHGLILRGASSSSSGEFYFTSSEDGTINLRPRLVITYR